MGQRLGGTIYAPLKANKVQECTICYMNMLPGERIIQTVCFETHQFHEKCFNNFLDHYKNQPELLLCPICRAPIEQDKLIKKILTKAADDPVEDLFNLESKPDPNAQAIGIEQTDSKLVKEDTAPIVLPPSGQQLPAQPQGLLRNPQSLQDGNQNVINPSGELAPVQNARLMQPSHSHVAAAEQPPQIGVGADDDVADPDAGEE